MTARLKVVLISLVAILCLTPAWAQSTYPDGSVEGPLTEASQPKKTSNKSVPAQTAPEAAGGESSSNQTKVDLRPPYADEMAHPGSGNVSATGQEKWNPMRAMKDVEVGNYYYNAGNYKAAIARYRDALEYKPRDAPATLGLGRALEKTKAFDEARQRYQEYLAILDSGSGADEAKKGLERLKKESTGSRK
jgi:Flp pilus assembly protein TadD